MNDNIILMSKIIKGSYLTIQNYHVYHILIDEQQWSYGDDFVIYQIDVAKYTEYIYLRRKWRM